MEHEKHYSLIFAPLEGCEGEQVRWPSVHVRVKSMGQFQDGLLSASVAVPMWWSEGDIWACFDGTPLQLLSVTLQEPYPMFPQAHVKAKPMRLLRKFGRKPWDVYERQKSVVKTSSRS